MESGDQPEGLWQVFGQGSRAQATSAADLIEGFDPPLALAVSIHELQRGLWRFEAITEDQDGAMAVQAALGPALEVHATPLEDRNWIALSLEGLPPVPAGRFLVAGGHALPRARTGRRVLHVEAGEAFGSGHHGTTRGCLLLLEHLSRRWPPARRRQGRALDVGTGSGVLAIAAAQAGFGHAEAYDIDPRAVAVTRENVSLNRVRGRVRAVGVSPGVRRMRQRAARFDLVFANILMRPLVRLAPDLAAAVAPGGRLVVSGLLAEQRPRIRAAYLGQGLVLERATRLDGWASMMFRRPA